MQTAFYRNVNDLIESIEHCYAQDRFLPCLILLFSGMDAMASLESGGRTTGADFKRWTQHYLLKARSLPCTPAELWGARCGIVHTFTAESDLSRNQKVRKLIYAWGSNQAEDLTIAARAIKREDYVGVHLRELIDAFRCGISDFANDLHRDPQRLQRAERAAGSWFIQADGEVVKRVAELASKGACE